MFLSSLSNGLISKRSESLGEIPLLDKEITITDIKLKHKSGGKSGIFNA